MKQFLLFGRLACSTNFFSQMKPVLYKFKNGQHIKILVVNNQDAEPGMGMQMKNNMTAIAEATAPGTQAGRYSLNCQVKKLTTIAN
ncbi:MAG: hypothetical protein WAT19_08945 [Ferruginibacter sp.]